MFVEVNALEDIHLLNNPRQGDVIVFDAQNTLLHHGLDEKTPPKFMSAVSEKKLKFLYDAGCHLIFITQHDPDLLKVFFNELNIKYHAILHAIRNWRAG